MGLIDSHKLEHINGAWHQRLKFPENKYYASIGYSQLNKDYKSVLRVI